MTILLIPILFALLIALAVFSVEYADRRKLKRLADEADYLRGSIEQAERRHAPRKHLYRQLVEAKRKELAHE